MKSILPHNIQIGRASRVLLLLAILAVATPMTTLAGWVWPWQGDAINHQLAQAQEQAAEAQQSAKVMENLLILGVIAGLITFTVMRVKRSQVKPASSPVVVMRTPAQTVIADKVIIDGQNVIYGSGNSTAQPTFMNLLGLLLELQKRGCAFKCFFDASTFYALRHRSSEVEARAYDDLCTDYPDHFVVVPGGIQADAYILDYSHQHGTAIISNDRYRDYSDKYEWLKTDGQRRMPFLLHSQHVKVLALGLEAVIPHDLKASVAQLRSQMPVSPVQRISRSKRAKVTQDHTGDIVMATA